MIAPRRRRALVAFFALAGFLTAGVSEARAIQPCAHHDALPGMEGGHHGAMRMGAPAATDVAAPHHEHGGAVAAVPADGPGSAVVAVPAPSASHASAGDTDSPAHGPCACIVCFDSFAPAPELGITALVVAFTPPPTVFVPFVRAELPTFQIGTRWPPQLPNAPPFFA